MEEDAGALAGGAHEAAEGLVHLGHAGNLVNTAESCFAPEVAQFGDTRALDGVHLGKSGADDHGVGDAAAEQVDALGKTGAKDEKERVGEDEGFLDPRGLGGEVGQPRLEGNADAGVVAVDLAGDDLGVGVGRKENRDGGGGRVGRGGLSVEGANGCGVKGGNGGGGGCVVLGALAERRIHAEVVGEIVGVGPPWGVGDHCRKNVELKGRS